MRIDSHQHFWKFDPIRDAWIDASMEKIARDFLPEDLKPLLDQSKIDGCVAVQADQSETETDFLLDLAGRYDFVKGVENFKNTLVSYFPDESKAIEDYIQLVFDCSCVVSRS